MLRRYGELPSARRPVLLCAPQVRDNKITNIN